MKKIMIAGCGELGSRFLQAAVTLQDITQIDIVEPNQQAIDTAVKRMNEMGRDLSTLTVNWFPDFEKTSAGDMAVIATQADTRLAVFEKVLAAGYRRFLVEKIVTQSDKDYTKMMELTKQYDAKVWVNCKTRNYPVWEYIKSKIDPSEKLNYHSIGGNHGLCTNGLHVIDLFVFLTEAKKLNIIEARFDHEVHLTKRGKYDLSGQVRIENDSNKSILSMDYERSHMQMPVEILSTKNYRWIVDNSTRQAFESSANGERNFVAIPFEGDVSVSVMSKEFINDILQNDSCALPTLADCYPAHHTLFTASLPLFNDILQKSDEVCPVT